MNSRSSEVRSNLRRFRPMHNYERCAILRAAAEARESLPIESTKSPPGLHIYAERAKLRF